MFIEQIKSEGLAHLSYVIGDGGEAAVIDPRRDCTAYLETAGARGCRITHIFETHRNEDLVSGAPALAAATWAPVHHGPNPEGEVDYADTVREGASVRLGKLRLDVLETPGHTDDSLSFALYDTDAGDAALAVFTGDALFIGDVGRTDFYPDRAREVAGLLFDSLRKIVALGDQAILYPAHGAGSVCGSGMADRDVSTIGMERRSNRRLRIEDREEFIDAKVEEHHYQPPYFRRMEQLNLTGGPPLPRPLTPPPLTAQAFEEAGALPVDVRGIAAFLGAHVPGSLALPADMVPAFAGWLLDPADDPTIDASVAAGRSMRADRILEVALDLPAAERPAYVLRECEGDGELCEVTFEDPELIGSARDALYYVRAIQEPTEAVNADNLRCGEDGECEPCWAGYRLPYDEDCLAEHEERAWSSPIWLRFDPERVPPPDPPDGGLEDGGAP